MTLFSSTERRRILKELNRIKESMLLIEAKLGIPSAEQVARTKREVRQQLRRKMTVHILKSNKKAS